MSEQHLHATIRPMQSGDLEALMAMARALADELGDLRPRLAPDELLRDGLGAERWFDCLVAEAGGGLVGYASFCRAFELHTGLRRLWLSDLYVAPRARRSGLGRALLAEVVRRARDLGCDAIYWELWRPNAVGRRFYEALGAEEVNDLAVMRLNEFRTVAEARRP
jgi:GNAT superfamily N-acetyltransferase